MSVKSLMFLTSALATAGLVIEPLAADAAGMSQLGTWGRPTGMGAGVSNLSCDGVPNVAGLNNIRQINLPRTPSVNTGSAFRPNIQAANGDLGGNIGFSHHLNVVGNNNSNANSDAIPRASTETNPGRGFGSRPLTVFGGGNSASTASSQHFNTETEHSTESYHASRQMPVAGNTNAIGAGSSQHVENSHLFGGSTHSAQQSDSVPSANIQTHAGFNGSHAGGFNTSKKIDADSNVSHFGGFSGSSNSAHAGYGGGKIEADSTQQHAGSSWSHSQQASYSGGKIDADSTQQHAGNGSRGSAPSGGGNQAGWNSSKRIDANNSISFNKNIDASKNVNVNKPITFNKNIDASKNVSVNKPVTFNKNIDASKNAHVNKPGAGNRNIDASKNVNVNKPPTRPRRHRRQFGQQYLP